MRRFYVFLAGALLLAGCQGSAPAATPTSAPAPTAAPTAGPAARAATEQRPVEGGPLLLRTGIALRKLVKVEGGGIKIARSPADGQIYFLNAGGGLYRLELKDAPSATAVASVADMVEDATPGGMAFGPDGALYVSGNRKAGGTRTQAIVRKGTPKDGGGFTWQTLAKSPSYALSNTPFDHLWNGLAVSPDGKFVYANSGSRTDHGEVEDNGRAYPDTREVPITSAIFRLPADAADLQLPNDEAGLKPYLFADGTRNAFELEFAPNGDLFGVDNGPDADYPDELNWLREGKHYGFPWRFGTQDNPQQFANYDGAADKRLSQDFTAVKSGTYKNDPSFPKAPGNFTDPIVNHGPAATQYRDDEGKARDAAAEGQPLTTFTPHRSPLGLVFANDAMPADLRSQGDTLTAFLLSWGSAGGTLTDRGQDLLQLTLTKTGESYEMTTQQIARDFKFPIDAVLVENRLYVLEYSGDGAIWELTFS